MDILEQSELDERLDEISRARLLLTALYKRIGNELAVIEQWLRVLEFRLRYYEGGEEDED